MNENMHGVRTVFKCGGDESDREICGDILDVELLSSNPFLKFGQSIGRLALTHMENPPALEINDNGLVHMPFSDSNNKKYIKTITIDNGPEFAAHKLITKYLGAVVYFADPYASWQKGAIENTNKLIRQYIPKHTNFDDVTDKKIASIQKKINSRPRQKLKFETPKAEFFERIA